MQIHMKMDIKSIEWDRSNREEGQDWSKFYFCSKRCSRRYVMVIVESLEMRKRLLLIDGNGVAYFKESSTGVTKALMER